jgi:hypothetical protein
MALSDAASVSAQDSTTDAAVPCSPYPYVTGKIRGEGFDAWEGAMVQGTLIPTQIGPLGHDEGVVKNGRFELSGGACSYGSWKVDIDHALTCNEQDGHTPGVLTPADCGCYGAFQGGAKCDAGFNGVVDGGADGALGDVVNRNAIEGGE